MMLASTGPSLPIWAVVPPCAILMLVIAGYVMAMREAKMPESRRRIRTAGCIVMMMTMPIIVYIFAIVTPESPRRFMLTWAMLIGLLSMLVLLALIDVVNNVRLHAKMKAEILGEMSSIQAEVHKIVSDHAAKSDDDDDAPNLRLAGDEPDAPPTERT